MQHLYSQNVSLNQKTSNKTCCLQPLTPLTPLTPKKAFDVVDQNSLLRKLYLDGVHGDDWLLLKDLYSDCSSRVKWAGQLSDPFFIDQGVRQGGVISTGHYKRYNNPLLLHLEESLYRG